MPLDELSISMAGHGALIITTETINQWLEWAGERLMSLPSDKVFPQKFKTSWPDYSLDQWQVLNFRPGEHSRPAIPTATDITLMDEILTLITQEIIPSQTQRQILQSRLLINPYTGRHVNSWNKIAKKLHSSRDLIKTRHQQGLNSITRNVPLAKVCRIAALWSFDIP